MTQFLDFLKFSRGKDVQLRLVFDSILLKPQNVEDQVKSCVY